MNQTLCQSKCASYNIHAFLTYRIHNQKIKRDSDGNVKRNVTPGSNGRYKPELVYSAAHRRQQERQFKNAEAAEMANMKGWPTSCVMY